MDYGLSSWEVEARTPTIRSSSSVEQVCGQHELPDILFTSHRPPTTTTTKESSVEVDFQGFEVIARVSGSALELGEMSEASINRLRKPEVHARKDSDPSPSLFPRPLFTWL